MLLTIGVGNVGAVGAIAPTLFGLRCCGVTVFLVRLNAYNAEFSERG